MVYILHIVYCQSPTFPEFMVDQEKLQGNLEALYLSLLFDCMLSVILHLLLLLMVLAQI